MIWIFVLKLTLVAYPLVCAIDLVKEYKIWKTVPIKEYEIKGYSFVKDGFMPIVVDLNDDECKSFRVSFPYTIAEPNYKFRARVYKSYVHIFEPFNCLALLCFWAVLFSGYLFVEKNFLVAGDFLVIFMIIGILLLFASNIHIKMQKKGLGVARSNDCITKSESITDEQARAIEQKELVTGVECLQWLKHANEQEYRWQRWLLIPAALFLGLMIYRLFLYF